MLAMSETEVTEIDNKLNIKMQWAEDNKDLAEQLAMDSTRLMSCTNERLDDYKNKGFFTRCCSSFSGKTAEMQRDNQNDLIEMQKMGWRYLQMINERDILMAHSLITIKNNLETLAISDAETKKEITRFAVKVKERFTFHSKRLDELEISADIQHWLTTIEVRRYDKYSKHMRLLCLVRDFSVIKAQDWNMQNILCLQQAIHNAKIDSGEKITLEKFVSNLIDEIEESSFEMFNEITTLSDSNIIKIDTLFLVEAISSPIFNSLHQISDNYRNSDIAVDTLIEHLNIEKKDAIKKIILGHIEKAGVVISKEIQFQDIALEILSCSKLAQDLFNKTIKDEDKKVLNLAPVNEPTIIINDTVEEHPIKESIKPLMDLELSLIAKNFGVGDGFEVLIDNNGVAKSFGDNRYGCLGIGSNESNDIPVDVIDLPKDVKCVSIDVGHRHTLALLENGDVYAWGSSRDGQLGDNTYDERLSAFKTIGLPKDKKAIKILAGVESSIVLLENGDLFATGRLVDSSIFLKYDLDFKVQDIELLYDNSYENGLVLLKANNEVIIKNIHNYKSTLDWCSFDEDGFYKPSGLHENAIIKKLIAGSDYFFILTEDNTLYGIGQNRDGQLGLNKRSNNVKYFSKVYGIEGEILQVTTSHERTRTSSENESHFTLILSDKDLYGCGTNRYYQLGKQENYYTTSYESGIIFKDTNWSTHYVEEKPKIVSQLSDYVRADHKIEICIGNDSSNLLDITDSKIYQLGDSYNYEDPKIIDFHTKDK